MRALMFLTLLGGCTLFEDPPDRSCQDDRQCFTAQGERCNADKVCEVPTVDAAAAQADDPELELATEVAQ